MLDCVLFEMFSEILSLSINELQIQNKDFSNLTFIFSCYIVVFGEIVVPLQADK